MISSTTRSSQIRSGPERWRLYRHLGVVWTLALAATLAHAHGEADDPLPAEPGTVAVEAAAALRHLRAEQVLPSARLDGFLLQGDTGDDPSGSRLEHGTLGLSWRATQNLGGQWVVGKHGNESAHVEAAWLQWRHDTDEDSAWLFNLGRQTPAMGGVLAGAGHLDRFGLRPLAQRMALDHDWIDDGLQLGWRGRPRGGELALDAGVWRGKAFPGARDGRPVPSLHLGWRSEAWALDGIWARFQPLGRGTSIAGAAGHSHTAPVCNAALVEVACFTGSTELTGGSVRWSGREASPSWPWTFTAAGWLRQDRGSLESANGLARYDGRNQGGWLEAIWHVNPRWELGWRGESLGAHHALQGPGAAMLVRETRLDRYRSATRHALMLGYRPVAWASLHLEAGRESVAGTRAGFIALRLVMTTQHFLTTP
ncbi:hypothetical protein [Hydrogenophaga sp.]|uniref:hypothetical protein n=1 Tax=Hydrogenophaga sp. TaxID=1904254 RepID=UPI0026053189|nr:hypothetical protein [Hydrogenophaga sp.]MCW5653123.1 hypothetical protein [Hydrogenophaga sp.]